MQRPLAGQLGHHVLVYVITLTILATLLEAREGSVLFMTELGKGRLLLLADKSPPTYRAKHPLFWVVSKMHIHARWHVISIG